LAVLAAASLSLSIKAMEPKQNSQRPDQTTNQQNNQTQYQPKIVRPIAINPFNDAQDNTKPRSNTPSPREKTTATGKYSSPRPSKQKNSVEGNNNQSQAPQETTNITCPTTTNWGNNQGTNKNQTDCHNNQSQSSNQDNGQCTGSGNNQGQQNNASCQNSTPNAPTRPGANITPGVCTNHRHIDITRDGKFSLLSCDKDIITGQVWTNSNVSDCYFQNSHFENIIIKDATLNNIHFHGTLTRLNYDKSTITNTTYEGELADVDFKKATLTNVLFTHSTIKGGPTRSSFDNANLINVWFDNCELQKGINFTGVHFNNVSFIKSTIEDMKIFTGAFVRNGDAWVQLNKKILTQVKTTIMHNPDGTITTNTDYWLTSYKNK
jgi:hypothetical protein